MIKLELKDIKNISFPDFKVVNIQFKPNEKFMLIEVEGGWLENDKDCGKELGNGTIYFSGWKEFNIRQYDPIVNQWIKLAFNNFEVLEDICEFDYLDHDIYLRGFGKSGLWIECQINSSFVKLEFEEIKDLGKYSA